MYGGCGIFAEIAALPNRTSNLKTFPLCNVTFGMATEPPASNAPKSPPEAVAAADKRSCWARAMISLTSCDSRRFYLVEWLETDRVVIAVLHCFMQEAVCMRVLEARNAPVRRVRGFLDHSRARTLSSLHGLASVDSALRKQTVDRSGVAEETRGHPCPRPIVYPAHQKAQLELHLGSAAASNA